MNTRNFESGTTLRTTATFNPMDNRCKTDLRGACIDFFFPRTKCCTFLVSACDEMIVFNVKYQNYLCLDTLM